MNIKHRFVFVLLAWLLVPCMQSLAVAQESTYILPDSLSSLLHKNEKNGIKRLQVLAMVIDAYFDEQRYNETVPYVEEMESIISTINDDYYTSLVNYYMGSCLSVNTKYKEAYLRLNTAQNEANAMPENDEKQLLKIRIHLALGACYICCGMLSEAYEQLQKGLELNDIYGTSKIQIKLYYNLAALYSQLEKYSESTAIYKKMLLAPGLFKHGFYYCNYNIANNFIGLNKPDSALVYLNAILDRKVVEEDDLLVVKKIGDAYRLKQNYIAAEKYYKEVLDGVTRNTIENKGIYASALHDLAELYFQCGKYDMALSNSDKSISLFYMLNNLSGQASCLGLKTRIFERIGNYEGAFNCLNQMNYIRDSIIQIQNIDRFNQLFLQQELKTMDKEYEQQRYINSLQHARQQSYFYAIVVVLLAVIIIVALLFNRKRILLKNKQIREEALSKELEMRNRELASNVVSLMKKNEIFTEIVDKLLSIREGAVKDETKEALLKITKEIERIIEGNFWKDFEMRFKQVHSVFYDKLIRNYPDLTPNEIRLCAFLKLNLTTKDISSVTGQSVQSIEKARYRLRKKLGIQGDTSENLSIFISKL